MNVAEDQSLGLAIGSFGRCPWRLEVAGKWKGIFLSSSIFSSFLLSQKVIYYLVIPVEFYRPDDIPELLYTGRMLTLTRHVALCDVG